jgi:hypothetical protein
MKSSRCIWWGIPIDEFDFVLVHEIGEVYTKF